MLVFLIGVGGVTKHRLLTSTGRLAPTILVLTELKTQIQNLLRLALGYQLMSRI